MMALLIIVFLNIDEECQSICNGDYEDNVNGSAAGGDTEYSNNIIDNDEDNYIIMLTTMWWYGHSNGNDGDIDDL